MSSPKLSAQCPQALEMLTGLGDRLSFTAGCHPVLHQGWSSLHTPAAA